MTLNRCGLNLLRAAPFPRTAGLLPGAAGGGSGTRPLHRAHRHQLRPGAGGEPLRLRDAGHAQTARVDRRECTAGQTLVVNGRNTYTSGFRNGIVPVAQVCCVPLAYCPQIPLGNPLLFKICWSKSDICAVIHVSLEVLKIPKL